MLAVPGIKLTGWWHDEPPNARLFGELHSIWPGRAATLKLEKDILEGPDQKKHQFCAYVRIRQYPAEWLDVVGKSLECFVKLGAAISWAGGGQGFLQ